MHAVQVNPCYKGREAVAMAVANDITGEIKCAG